MSATNNGVAGRYSYAYIATATTTQVKSGAGLLHSITINTATAVGNISVIDNTSGSTVNIALIAAATPGQTLMYNLNFTTGLRIITAGASDLTISYI